MTGCEPSVRSIPISARFRTMLGTLALACVAVVFTGCGPSASTSSDSAARHSSAAQAPSSSASRSALSTPNEAKSPRDAACRWLEQQQSADGAWRSTVVAYLAGGQALTPFVLFALLEARARGASIDEQVVDRALDFIRQQADARGVLGDSAEGTSEYPNYATSFALRCLQRVGDPADFELRHRMRAYLVDQQYSEANGFAVDHLAYGGWGMGGKRPLGAPGHMDISYTRHVLEALAETGPIEASVADRALTFLRLVQRRPEETRAPPSVYDSVSVAPYDGGFYFSPVVLAANKGDRARGAYSSYSTATCDGLLALLALGRGVDDERVRDAARWLTTQARPEAPVGIDPDDPTGWVTQILCYHFAVQAEALAALDAPGIWRGELAAAVMRLRQPDGSYVNVGGALMKEDDPLVATALVLVALSHCGS